MPFRPEAQQPEFHSLLVSFAESKLKKNDEATYQTVKLLIERIRQFQGIVVKKLKELEEEIEDIQPVTNNIINYIDESGEEDSGGGGGIPGTKGDPGSPGATGAQGNAGPPGLDGEQGEVIDPYVFLGPKGDTGPAGSAGAAGSMGPPGFDGECCDPYLAVGPPGPAGVNGTIGRDGLMGPPGYDAEEPLEPLMIPGPQGIQGPAGGGGAGSITTVEVDLGSSPTWRGSFTITDATITGASKVAVWQAPGPYTGKGTRADEAEMDPIWCVASPGSGQATVYWRTHTMIGTTFSDIRGQQPIASGNTQHGEPFRAALIDTVLGRVKGNVKFHYMVA